MNVRLPAVSGSFYPALPSELVFQIESYFHPRSTDVSQSRPKMLIVPHAGYLYSGQIAADAFSLLEPFKHVYQRVVILGPAHTVALRGIALPDADFFETPLGKIRLDQSALAAIESLPFVNVKGEAHAMEHSLEVQLPFLQTVLNPFELVPLVVGESSASEVREVLTRLWGGAETLIVVSTDLSHFLYYSDAHRVDSETIKKIRHFESNISGEEACGHFPLNGALSFAKDKGLRIDSVSCCNSGDVGGDRDRVVGYASFALYTNGPQI